MAVDIKVAPDEKLELVQTYITDTNPNSDYFNISELPDTFSGGKNAFLIAGTDKLLANTEIKIQIRDANGNVCYVEYSNGNPEYYEGNSKVVAVYVYPTVTAFGPATITILGQLKDVPQEWNGLYSVKWTKQVNINPALANTTRVRFYKRPAVSITEIVEPLYTFVSGSKTASLIEGSFASIKVNQLETFAGDVKRIKVYRTAQGDISDYDLIQDILVESKNLLTTYELSGSVVGNGGLFTNDSLSKLWLTGSLHAVLDSTHVEDGLQLTGSGTFTYSSSLNLLSSNTYELELDSYFVGSTSNTLGIYVSYPTMSLSSSGIQSQSYTTNTTIAILSGSTPTKNFGTQTFPFTIPVDYPSASLYLSQSSGTTQWHVGNISLNVSQDTAFSPNEISFVTSMPTVLTNETFNFKFEFYDVNNNYVPVAVTQSALFVGGTNFNTLQSGSLYTSASLTALSQSVSGTIGIVTGSVAFVSTSVSSSLSQSFGATAAASASISQSTYYAVTSSVSTSFSYTSASVSALSASLSASQFISSNFNYSYSAYLSTNIFTDSTGKLIKTPATSSTQNGLYTGQTYLGYYSGSSWKTYMANNGNFYLTSSVAGGGFMSWDAAGASLAIAGNITILGGDAATTSSLNSATASLKTTINTTSQSLSASLAPNIFTDSNGKIVRPPTNPASNYGLFLASDHLGFYSASATDGGTWKTYMDNVGKFYLTGSASNYLKWDGSVLTIAGAINITGGTASDQITGAASSGSNALTYAIANNATASVAAVDAKVFTNALGRITKTPSLGSTAGLYLGSANLGYYNGTAWKTYMDNTGLFYLTGSAGGNALLWDGSTLSINGSINVTGGNAATTTYADTIGSNASSSAYTMATTSANTAQSNASSSAYTMATTSANTAYTNASASAYTMATISANSALTTAKAVADSIAAGTYSGGTYIDGKSIISPIVAGANGYFSQTFKVGNGGITLDGVNKLIYVGAGNYANADTAFYVDNSSNFSLGSKLTWNGSTLSINGNITATNGSIGGWVIDSSLLRSSDSITRMNSTNKEFAVMDSNNLNYYRARVGAGNTFLTQPNIPFSEMNALGVRVSGGSSTSGYGIFANLQGYNDPANSTRGTSVAIYSTIDYTTSQFVPCYTILQENASGVDTTVSALQTEGGAYLRNSGNTSVTGIGQATNQGFALIVEGKTYLGGGYTGNGPMVYIAPAAMRVDPSSPGLNYTLKIIQSTGEVFRSSSSRTKKNILGKWSENINVLDKIKVTPVEKFRYKSWENKRPEFYTIGLIAEDLHDNGLDEAVIYELDKYNKPTDIPETIDYEKISSILWKGMQELLERVENLETQLKNK